MQLRITINLGYYLALSSLLHSFATASELNSSNKIREEEALVSGKSRHLQTAECTLLLKVISYEDGHDEKQVDCFDAKTKSYLKVENMQRDVDIQSELLSKFQTGALKSAESTMTIEAFVEGISLVLPNDGISKATFGHSPHSRRRRLAISGPVTFLAVRVVGLDVSPTFSTTDISDAWYGSYGQQLNFKSQAEACSNNAFSVSKVEAPDVIEGVMEVTVSTNINGTDVHEDETGVEEVLDVVDNLPIDYFPDHVILCYSETC